MILGVERPGTQIVRGQLSKYGVWGLKGDVILAESILPCIFTFLACNC